MKEWIIRMLCAGWVFFSPVHTAVIGVFIMVVADLITGIWKAKVKNTKIESKKLRSSIGKFIAYESLILLSFIFDSYFIVPFLGSTLFFKFVTFLIGSTEFLSLVENFGVILNMPDLKQRIIEFLSQNKK